MATKKILTITLEIEVNETVTRYPRLEVTYSEVVRGAVEAARGYMPKDSIRQITTHARWEYRHWDPDPITYPKGELPGPDPFAPGYFEWEGEPTDPA
ncbi:hypothetical protein OG210_21760 [Streptomyces sp. NBC_00466]|uniref:hypothetical protein n=1 Tax=Streptomyces sp. NBC_00466 TaxID=2903655 RepID=UPI0030E5648D